MADLFDMLKWLWNNATPKLTLVLVMALGILQWLQIKKQQATAKTLAHHLDPENKYPHPECEWSEQSYEQLCKQLEKLHEENREDHKEIRELILGSRKIKPE